METAQQVRCSLRKHEDLSSYPQHPSKSWHGYPSLSAIWRQEEIRWLASVDTNMDMLPEACAHPPSPPAQACKHHECTQINTLIINNQELGEHLKFKNSHPGSCFPGHKQSIFSCRNLRSKVLSFSDKSRLEDEVCPLLPSHRF